MTSAVRIRQLETLFIDKLQEKYKLTERDLKRAFAFYDTDKNGILDVAELLACISTYLNGVSRQEVQSLVDCYDVNGDGKISYEEFYEMLTTRSATENAQTGNGSNNNQKSRGAPAPSRGGSRSNNVPDHYSVDDMSLDSARFRGDNFSNNYNDGYRRSQQQQQLERVKQYEDTQYDRHRVPDNNSRYMPPAPPSQSDLSSVVDLNNEAELSARATSYLSNLKIMLTTQANAAKARIRTADRLSMHQTELVATISKDIIYKAFQPFIHEGSFDSMSGGRRYGRPPMGVSMAEFIKVLRQFTKTGASVINVDVAKHVWAMCMEYSSSGSSELLEPDALFHLLFHKDPNNNGGPSNNHIVRGGILPLDSVQATHPETVGDSFKSGLIQQQALMLPPPPPGSFKKIIAHPTRTLLTVPANFEPDLVNASARLPKYECVMEHVFGMSNNLYSGNQIYVSSDAHSGKPLLVYSSAAVGVMHDPSTNRQAFFNGHTDDITCISMSADTKVLATGQVGKEAYLNVWSLKALSCAHDAGRNDLYIPRDQVTSSATGIADSSSSPAWVCKIGGSDGYSPGFFQRGVCAVELSPTGQYVLAVGCDDKHRMGIWDITRGGALICDTVTQNGLPPQIKGVYWCPTRQQTGDFVTKEHCGDCDMFVTIGVHHLKFWSFASKPENFISNSVTGGGNLLIARAGKIDKLSGVSQPAINLCAAYIVNSDGQADLVTGGSNGFVYLYRQGVCVAASCMGKKPNASHQATVAPAAQTNAADTPGSSSSISNPHAVFSIAVAHNTVFAGGRNGTIHCLDIRSLQKIITLNLFDSAPERPSSAMSRNSARGATIVQASGNANILVTGIAVLMTDSSTSSGTSSKVSKREKHLRLVATTSNGVAKYVSVSVGSSSLTMEKASKDLFHYHMGSLWGLAVEHGRHVSSRSGEGKLLVSCGDDKVVAVWDTKRWKQLCSVRTQAAAKCCYLDEMLQYVAVGLSSGGVLVYSIYVSEGSSGSGSGGDDTASVASISSSSRMRPGSASTGARMPTAQRARPSAIASGTVSVNLVQRVYRKDSTSEISDMKFDSRGNLLAVGSHDRCVYLYQMVAGNTYNLKLLHRLQGHNAYITHLDFSNDNKMLRTTCGAYELLFWNCETGKQVTSTAMNESWRTNTVVLGFEAMGIWPPGSDGTDVNSVDVCKESGLLAAADDFGTLKLFNYPCIVKHAPGRAYGGHCSHVVNTRFYNDGHNNCTTHLVTVGGNDCALISWSVRPIQG